LIIFNSPINGRQ